MPTRTFGLNNERAVPLSRELGEMSKKRPKIGAVARGHKDARMERQIPDNRLEVDARRR